MKKKNRFILHSYNGKVRKIMNKAGIFAITFDFPMNIDALRLIAYVKRDKKLVAFLKKQKDYQIVIEEL